MHLKVHIGPVGSGTSSSDEVIKVHCGQGQQILRWLGYTACARLAQRRGDVHGCFVPQAVLNKEGQVLDADVVINQLLADGEDVFVEYGDGPAAFRSRWEGRPSTPPFQWGGTCELLPPHDSWLRALDLRQEGLTGLVEGLEEGELAATQQLLVQHAGALQMLFLYYSCEGCSSPEQIGRLTLPQFRSMAVAAKVVSAQFTADRVDDIFTRVATSESVLNRKISSSGVSWFSLHDFLVALVPLAHARYTAESFGNATAPLSTQVLSLLQECLMMQLYPSLQRKLEKLEAARSPGAVRLLAQGRRLTEQTLDACQTKRQRSDQVAVELRYICRHLQQWQLLGKELTLQELALVAIYALQACCEPEHFVLQPLQLECGYEQFERLLLGLVCLMYTAKKKYEAFEEFLGEVMDGVYKRAGVLVMTQQAQAAQQAQMQQQAQQQAQQAAAQANQ